MNLEHTPELIQPKYTISAPSASDAEELAAMAYQSWVDTYPSEENGVSVEYIKQLRAPRITNEGIDSLRLRIERLETDSNFFLRVAKDSGGHVVGFIDGERGEDKYELQDLFTDKSTHGSGLAMKLWESYKEWVDPSKPIWLNVVPYTGRAQAFYKKVGFHDVPGTEAFYKDTHLPIVTMERPPEVQE